MTIDQELDRIERWLRLLLKRDERTRRDRKRRLEWEERVKAFREAQSRTEQRRRQIDEDLELRKRNKSGF